VMLRSRSSAPTSLHPTCEKLGVGVVSSAGEVLMECSQRMSISSQRELAYANTVGEAGGVDALMLALCVPCPIVCKS